VVTYNLFGLDIQLMHEDARVTCLVRLAVDSTVTVPSTWHI